MSRENISPKGPYQGKPEVLRRPDGRQRIDYRGLTQDQNQRQIVGQIFQFVPISPLLGVALQPSFTLPQAPAQGQPTSQNFVTNNATWFAINFLNLPAGSAGPVASLTWQASLNNVPVSGFVPLLASPTVFQIGVLTPGTPVVGNNVYSTVPQTQSIASVLTGAIWRLNFDAITFYNSWTGGAYVLNGIWGTGDTVPVPLSNTNYF